MASPQGPPGSTPNVPTVVAEAPAESGVQDDGIFALTRERGITCPACLCRHRAHTKDVHCSLGPPPVGLRNADLKTLLKNSPSQKSICGTVSAQPDTPHPHSLNDDHTQSPSSMSNGSGRSCHTEVAEFSEESLSDGQKMSFPSQTERHKNTSFESIITNMSNDKGMNDTYFEVSRI